MKAYEIDHFDGRANNNPFGEANESEDNGMQLTYYRYTLEQSTEIYARVHPSVPHTPEAESQQSLSSF